MSSLVIVCFIAFGVGSLWGNHLGKQGVTSDNALKNHQKVLVWLLLAIAPLLGGLVLLDKLNLAPLLPKIFPPMMLIYLAGYFHEIIMGFGCLGAGLLLFLELSNQRSRRQVKQLAAALGTITFALSILLFLLQPVQAAAPKIIDGVVMQTTLFTCAPASIATLARTTKKHPQLTEKEVVTLTKTNRFGTTTLGEIRALEQLGLSPQYRHNLTTQDLSAVPKIALMHVKEKRKNGKGVRFSHAVAYLGVDPARQLVLIGNPLYGLQIKSFDELQEYWFGELIFVE